MSGFINRVESKSGIIQGRKIAFGRQNENGSQSAGIQTATRNLVSSTNLAIAKFYHGGSSGDSSEGACGIIFLSYRGWWGHYGGSQVTVFNTATNTSYGSPGGATLLRASSGEADDITFSIGTDSDTRILQASGGNGYGPNPCHITIIANAMCPWEILYA